MKQYNVTGMSCAACQARVEKAVRAVPGVTEAAVSLLTNSMGVSGTASDKAIIDAVVKAGYGASVKGSAAAASPEDTLAGNGVKPIARRLITSAVFLILLMYVSMGHHMWGFPVPAFFEGNIMGLTLLQLILSSIILLINKKFFVSGFKGAAHLSPNMDTLVALGSSASYLWSLYALFRMTGAPAEELPLWADKLYFESAAMILVLITVGKLLEEKSKGRTTNAIRALMKLSPQTATIIRDGAEVTVSIEEVRVGDIFTVRPGESIPTDGEVIEGETSVNESALTGESIPADKTVGSRVSAGTLNVNGYIRCRATRVGEDTTLSGIIRLVSDAAATKAPIARLADKVSGVFVPAVTMIALVTLIVWLCIGRPFPYALERAISVLVISCPCALGLATPVAIMVGNGVGAKSGVLFKTAASLEQCGKTAIIALDKTGTVTKGEPAVMGLYPADGVTENELLHKAASLEQMSEHPLAGAILREAEKRNIKPSAVSGFTALTGNGLTATLNGSTLAGGSVAYLKRALNENPALGAKAEQLAARGETPLVFTENNRLIGLIAVADTLKEDSAEAIKELNDLGIRTVLLTGDNPVTARAIGGKAGISHIAAGVLPSEKAAVVERLKTLGPAAMVGDGINDAPALTAADIGIAIGAGTDVAIDAADVVLMNSSLRDVAAAVRLSRRTLTNIRENLFWAFFYNVIGIPLAAGCYVSLFGWELSPMFGAAAMSLSSFCVVMNALRLNLFQMKKPRGQTPARVSESELTAIIEEINRIKEEQTMTKTLKIDGMMCTHCEARVKKTLEAIEGVTAAEVSFQKGTAILTLNNDIPNEVFEKALDEQGYPVLGIE